MTFNVEITVDIVPNIELVQNASEKYGTGKDNLKVVAVFCF